MTDKERIKLVKELHKELTVAGVPHIVCVEMFDKESADLVYGGGFLEIIKMIGAFIATYSKNDGKDILDYLAIALGGEMKK